MMNHTGTHKTANRMNEDSGLIKMIDTLMKCNVAARMTGNTGLFELRDPLFQETQKKGKTSGLTCRH